MIALNLPRGARAISVGTTSWQGGPQRATIAGGVGEQAIRVRDCKPGWSGPFFFSNSI